LFFRGSPPVAEPIPAIDQTMTDSTSPPPDPTLPPARPRWRSAAWGLGKWLAAIVGLVVLPQVSAVGLKVLDAQRTETFEVEFTRIDPHPTLPLAELLRRSVHTHLQSLECTPLVRVDTDWGALWRTRCTGRRGLGKPAAADGMLLAGKWEIARTEVQPSRELQFADLIPPWWLLLATCLPVLLLLRHRWLADLADRWRQPWRSAGWALLPVTVSVAVGMAATVFGVQREGMMTALQGELAARPDRGLIVAIALLAPLLEELVFRGLAWHWLRSSWGATGTLLLSSAVFVGLHAGQYQGIGLLLVAALALALGTIRERTGSLLLCIAGHALVNGFAVAALLGASSS
jgi:membrane protease YdiL (CAAX protease family)